MNNLGKFSLNDMGKASAEAAHCIAEILGAGEDTQRWCLFSILSGIGEDLKREILNTLDESLQDGEENRAERLAKNLLLDEPDLNAGEKALLAAFVLRGFYELESFTSRQITEYLKDSGNKIPNITSTFKSLVQKDLVSVTSTIGDSEQAHKKYILTASGEKFVRDSLSRRTVAKTT